MKEIYTVLGATGYVGVAIVNFLKRKGIPVNTPEREDILMSGGHMGKVIYCIGLTSDYINEPFATITAHIELLNKVLQFGKFSSLVYLSSARLYDSAEHGREDAYLKLEPDNPRHLYDLSKATGESLCHQSKRQGVKIARLSNVYGGSCLGDNLLHVLLNRLSTEKSLILPYSLHNERDYVFIGDVVIALLAILANDRYPVYNVVSGENVSNETIGKLLGSATGARISFENQEHIVKNTQLKKLSTSRLNEIGIYPTLVEDNIESLVKMLSRSDT